MGNGYKCDKNAFVFSLINKDNKPIKIKCNKDLNSCAIMCNDKKGPYFGFRDICIYDNSNLNRLSQSYLSFIYKHPEYKENSNEAFTFLAGDTHFQTLEIEVYHKKN
jgi:hypothetical protein